MAITEIKYAILSEKYNCIVAYLVASCVASVCLLEFLQHHYNMPRTSIKLQFFFNNDVAR